VPDRIVRHERCIALERIEVVLGMRCPFLVGLVGTGPVVDYADADPIRTQLRRQFPKLGLPWSAPLHVAMHEGEWLADGRLVSLGPLDETAGIWSGALPSTSPTRTPLKNCVEVWNTLTAKPPCSIGPSDRKDP